MALTGATVVHPFVHPFAHIGWHGVDPLDEPPLLSWSKVTERHLVDVPDRSLKVATRVRIPLGLLHAVDPVWATAVVRVGT